MMAKMVTASPPNSTKARAFRDAGLYVVTEFGLRVTSAFLVPLYIRVLRPDEPGVRSLSMMLITGLSLLHNPALHDAISRYYFELDARPSEQKPFQGTVSAFLFVWSAALTIALLFAGPLV
jgi:O-antigen/teichoic acid export membrane protein